VRGKVSRGPRLLRVPWFGLLKAAVTIIAIAYILWTVDLAAAWRSAVAWNPWLIAAALLALLAQVGCGGLRWHLIRARLDPSAVLWDSLRLFYVAAFCNSALWGALTGDVVRAWLVSYRGRTDAAILDRIAALGGPVLVIVTVPLFAARIGGGAAALVPATVTAAGLAGIVVASQLDRMPAAWRRFRLVSALQGLGDATRRVFLQPSGAIPVMAMSVAAEAANGCAAYFLADNLVTGLSFLDCIVVMQPIILLTALPISLGGWGARETAMIALLGFFGVPAGAALALSVQMGLAGIVIALPGSLFWLSMRSANRAAIGSA
jgi:hypothetical protein